MKRPVVITLLVAALLLLLAGIGAVVFFTINNSFPANSPFDVRNISSTLEESKTLKVDAEKPLTLNVDNAAGEVTVTGADVDTVQVEVVKTAYDSTQARADEEVKSIQYTIEQTGGVINIKYELPKSVNFRNNINTVDFVITVPNETTVDVETSFGDMAVANIKGSVTVSNDFGDVSVENIEGALSVNNDSGEVQASAIKAGSENIDLYSGFGKVTLEKASGADITIDSNSGAIVLNDVRATGTLSTDDDFGDTTYENGSAAILTIQSNSGKVSITKVNVRDELKIENDFGDIELAKTFAGSYDLHTNSGTVTVDGAKNKLKATTDFGNIKIENAQSLTLDIKTNSGTIEFSGSLGEGPHSVQSDFGEINLELPADSKLNVDLKTDFGGISSDIPLTVTLDGSSDESHQVGKMNGGGDLLTVITNSGGINITAIK